MEFKRYSLSTHDYSVQELKRVEELLKYETTGIKDVEKLLIERIKQYDAEKNTMIL